MAMSVGGKKGGPSSDINVTPLIDVLLVIIIIFMVITPLKPHGLHTLVPQPNHHKHKQTPQNDATIVVQVLDGGKVMINQTAVTWKTLGAQLEAIYKTRAEKVMFVHADKDIPFAAVARVVDIAKGVDPTIKVGILTPKMLAGH